MRRKGIKMKNCLKNNVFGDWQRMNWRKTPWTPWALMFQVIIKANYRLLMISNGMYNIPEKYIYNIISIICEHIINCLRFYILLNQCYLYHNPLLLNPLSSFLYWNLFLGPLTPTAPVTAPWCLTAFISDPYWVFLWNSPHLQYFSDPLPGLGMTIHSRPLHRC